MVGGPVGERSGAGVPPSPPRASGVSQGFPRPAGLPTNKPGGPLNSRPLMDPPAFADPFPRRKRGRRRSERNLPAMNLCRLSLLSLLLLPLAWSCRSPGDPQRARGSPPSAGDWETVGRKLGKDLAGVFHDPPTLLVRPLSWREAPPAQRRALTKVLARALSRTTGWNVRMEKPTDPTGRALVEITGRVTRGGGLLGGPGREEVEFTVRLAGKEKGTSSPWTTWYPLEDSCAGFG